MSTYAEERLQEIAAAAPDVDQPPRPRVGDIWANRYHDRRARVTRIWNGGRIALRTVVLAGNKWQDKRGGKSSTCDPQLFCMNYRLLVRAP